MFLSITIPALIFNCITNYIALSSIYKYYSLSEYSPRLLIIAILIIGRFPPSFLSVLTCVLNFDILKYNLLCCLYVALSWLSLLSWFGMLILTFYVLLILFSKFRKNTINKIGYIMIGFIFLIFGIFELVILPHFGAFPLKKFSMNNKNYNRTCSVNSTTIRNFLASLLLGITLFVFIVSVILFIYYYFYKKLEKRNSKHKIFLTFVLFSIVGIISPFISFIEKKLGVKVNETLKYVLMDILKISSGLYSLIYYMVEVYFRKKLKDMDVKFILRVKKTRAIYKDYLEEKGNRRLWDMLVQWENIFESRYDYKNYEVGEQKNLNRKEALKILEKHLDEVVWELKWYDKFYYYYSKLEKLGGMDRDLMMEGKE